MHGSLNIVGKRFNKWLVIGYGKYYVTNRGQKIPLFICKCDCGTVREVRATVLKCNRSKCCGCSKRMALGESSMRAIYNNYKLHAKKKNRKFEITLEQFYKLSQKVCYYCGSAPKNISGYSNAWGKFIYNGMDRVNNFLGYTVKNVVSCCKDCNRAKHRLSRVTFLNLVRAIYERHLK